MLVLGIETSCDETGVALLDEGRGLLAHVLHSQVAMHEAYGGVVPELASRDHVRRLPTLVDQCLAQAETTLAQIDLIAVTAGPGLAGALLVGSGFAHGLGRALGRPVIGVHHLEGHLLSPWLAGTQLDFPLVALLVSGGHTQLLEVAGPGRYRLLGETLDDAAGEAFDKCAHLLGLPYPGGPAVSRLAQFGQPGAYTLPVPLKHSGDLNFSFSGLKTAVAIAARRLDPVCEQARADLARAFVDAVVDALTGKAMAAVAATAARTLIVAGGVGANAQLRDRLAQLATRHGLRVEFPPPALCTDNGAMIALAGLHAYRRQHPAGRAGAPGTGAFTVHPRWPLPTLATGRDADPRSAGSASLEANHPGCFTGSPPCIPALPR